MDPAEVEAAWADVLARWGDEAAHRAFLDRFGDLEGLAEVGRRYRDVLAARPSDEAARRWRDEVVKRATALALAQMPRTRPPRELPRGLRITLLALLGAASVSAAGWLFLRLAQAARSP
jgi:hypothetical protein